MSQILVLPTGNGKKGKAILLIGLLIIGVGIIALTTSESAKEWFSKIFLKPPETIVTTVTETMVTTTDGVPMTTTITQPITTTPMTTPVTTPYTTPGQPPPAYDAKIVASGSFGFYDMWGNEVKVYPLEFAAEGKTVSYYETTVINAQVLGGSGLNPDSFVIYVRTQAFVTSPVIRDPMVIIPDITIFMSDMAYMHGYSFDDMKSYKTPEMGEMDLTNHWYGYYGLYTTPTGKKAVQKIQVWDIYEKMNLPRVEGTAYQIIWDGDPTTTTTTTPIETTTPYSPPPEETTTPIYTPGPGGEPYEVPTLTTKFTFIHETFVECWGFDGKFYSAVERHKMYIEITEKGELGFTVTGGGIGGINPLLLVALGVIITVLFVRRRKRK